MIIIGTIFIYFCILLLISKLTIKKGNNETFFRATRQSPWYLVAFGMIGASISGVTFVSVPGMVIEQNMTYAQTCMGFILGYVLVAFVLLPIYYRLNLITIYSFLKERLGERSYKIGASFFILSKMSGATVKFYVVCMILQRFVLDNFTVPFPLTVVVLVLLIWLYTHKGGIRTLVFTDSFQTLCMFLTLFLIVYKVIDALNLDLVETFNTIVNNEHSQISTQTLVVSEVSAESALEKHAATTPIVNNISTPLPKMPLAIGYNINSSGEVGKGILFC